MTTHADIEAQIREIQQRKKDEKQKEDDSDVGLGSSGFFDQDIYNGGGKFEGYVTSINPNDEYDVSALHPIHGKSRIVIPSIRSKGVYYGFDVVCDQCRCKHCAALVVSCFCDRPSSKFLLGFVCSYQSISFCIV